VSLLILVDFTLAQSLVVCWWQWHWWWLLQFGIPVTVARKSAVQCFRARVYDVISLCWH